VLLAACLGIVSGGKKLFEVIYFMLTYAVLENIPPADYLGALTHANTIIYTGTMLMLNLFLSIISFTARSYQARHL
jgi:hypothetical protein